MFENLRYRAFISYSHHDVAVARWLHRKLESYRIPKSLVGQSTNTGVVPLRLGPIFRDEDELPASSELGPQILDALRESSWLIVVCSPAAASSKWVGEEIRAFRALGREGRVLCVLAAGEPTADPHLGANYCFPPALFEAISEPTAVGVADAFVEPLAADLRPGSQRRLALLKIVAGLITVKLDALRQRDLERRNRIFAVAGLVAGLLAVSMTWLAMRAFVAQKDAELQTAKVLATTKNLLARRLAQLSEDTLDGSLPRPATEAWLLAIQANELSNDPANLAALQASASQARRQLLQFHVAGEVTAMEFSRDGTMVAIGYRTEPDPGTSQAVRDTNFIQIWAIHEGKALGAPIAIFDCETMRFSPSGRHLVCNGGDSLGVFDLLDTGPVLRLSNYYIHHRSPQIVEIAFANHDKSVTTRLEDGRLQEWNLESLMPQNEPFLLEKRPAQTLTYSRDGQLLAVAFADGLIRSFTAATRNMIGSSRRTTTEVASLRFSSDGKQLMASLSNGQMISWPVEGKGDSQAWFSTSLSERETHWLHSPDGSVLASWGRGNVLRLLAREAAAPWIEPLVQDAPVQIVAIDEKAQTIGVGAADGSVRLWKLSMADPLVSWQFATEKEVTSLSIHEYLLAVAQVNGTIELFDWNRRKSIGKVSPSSPDPILRVAFVSNGERIIAQDSLGELHAWDRQTLLVTPLPKNLDSLLESLGWTSKLLTIRLKASDTTATVVHERNIELLGASTELSTNNLLQGHQGEILALASSIQDRWLASGSEDRSVRLWDVATRQPTGKPLIHGGEVSALVFASDGKSLFSASHDRQIRQWDLDAEAWTDDICSKAKRRFTTGEWHAFFGNLFPYSPSCERSKKPLHVGGKN